jgi:hypothetical protein
MCDCERPANQPQNLGALYAPIDPSAERVQFAQGETAPTPDRFTLDDVWQFVGFYQIFKLLSEL